MYLWDLQSREIVQVLKGHTGAYTVNFFRAIHVTLPGGGLSVR